jgi:hypothetical protein
VNREALQEGQVGEEPALGLLRVEALLKRPQVGEGIEVAPESAGAFVGFDRSSGLRQVRLPERRIANLVQLQRGARILELSKLSCWFFSSIGERKIDTRACCALARGSSWGATKGGMYS